MWPLAQRYLARFEAGTRPRLREALQFLREDAGFSEVRAVPVVRPAGVAPRMQPVEAAVGWGLPAFTSADELAEFLEITPGELDWFADLRGWEAARADARLAHYRYQIVEKRSGRLRLIEAPKSRLKRLQRTVLSEMLNRIPLHDAVHGFRKGRSIVTFAAPHAGRDTVLRLDLRDFFPSIGRARVQAVFRTMGYPESTADLLGGLATHRTPGRAWAERLSGADPGERRLIAHARELYRNDHLPQGAPTSPAIANLCFYRADCRLAGLAASAGAGYTRYADDLAFSGDGEFARRAREFAVRAAAILREEGFAVEHRKTRMMRQGVRQRLAGLVVNERVNFPRDEYDRLKAILTNCVRRGPGGQNREGRGDWRLHLEGRVAFVEMLSQARGTQLRRLLEAIEWAETG